METKIFMKILLFLIFSSLTSFAIYAQDMIVINPQLMKVVLYRDIENIIYIPNIAQKKYTLTTSPACKVEKTKYVDDSGLSYPCFKLSEIPDTKTLNITLGGSGVSYGTFRYVVVPNAPKNKYQP